MASHDGVLFEVPLPLTPRWAQTYDLGQQDGMVTVAADGRLLRLPSTTGDAPALIPHTGAVRIDLEGEDGTWHEAVAVFRGGMLTGRISLVPR